MIEPVKLRKQAELLKGRGLPRLAKSRGVRKLLQEKQNQFCGAPRAPDGELRMLGSDPSVDSSKCRRPRIEHSRSLPTRQPRQSCAAHEGSLEAGSRPELHSPFRRAFSPVRLWEAGESVLRTFSQLPL